MIDLSLTDDEIFVGNMNDTADAEKYSKENPALLIIKKMGISPKEYIEKE